MPISVAQPSQDPQPLAEPWSWNVPQLMTQLTASQQQTVMGRLRAVGAIGADVKTWPAT